MTAGVDERRRQPRIEPAVALFVIAALAQGHRARAQVLDHSRQGMRLLFRPGVDLDPGMAIALSDATGNGADPAQVQWCHHKHHFTVAGVRAQGDGFVRCRV